jgi:hypothetical protein
MSLHLKERRGSQERLRKKLLRASSTIPTSTQTHSERENVLIDSFLDLLILKNSWPFA